MDQETACHIPQCDGKVVSAYVCPARVGKELATYRFSNGCNKQLQSWSLRSALKGARMDVKFHSEVDTPFSIIKVMTCIKVVLGKGL